MMIREKTREKSVFIIDSHLLMRRILTSMMRNREEIGSVFCSGPDDTEELFHKITEESPDIIFLGVEEKDEPEMQLFYRIREARPDIPVVVMAQLNRSGALSAIEALRAGAVDFISKPEREHGLIFATRHFMKRVTPALNSLTLFNPARLQDTATTGEELITGERVASPATRFTGRGPELVVMGSCQGGVRSLFQVISGLPASFRVPMVIVQHMPKIFTRVLAEALDEITPLNVREGAPNSVLIPGQVYVAPGGFHTVIKNEAGRRVLLMHRGPREHRCRPSIDVLLRSAVQLYGDSLLSVFLSGGGRDGLLGADYVKESGGSVLLESRESALLWDTGQKIFQKYRAEQVHVDHLAREIVRRVSGPSVPKGVNNARRSEQDSVTEE